jgi:hypothetical protein
MVKISRRALIGTGVAATGLAAFGGYRLFAPIADKEGTIAAFIARHVPQVRASDEAVTTFAAEVIPFVEQRFHWNFDAHIAIIANPVLQRFLDAEQLMVQDELERTLLTTFLRSTDLLLQGEPGGPVSYLTLADPYTAGCSNPLAQLG